MIPAIFQRKGKLLHVKKAYAVTIASSICYSANAYLSGRLVVMQIVTLKVIL